MDDRRFDALTRLMAQRPSRRAVVRGIAAGVFGGAAVAKMGPGVFAQTACDVDEDCADDEICCVGTCRAIECCIDEEDPNARCPEGTSCFEGICEPIDDGGGCVDDTSCAEGEICCAGACRAIECCIDDPDPNARCPEGTSCFEGYCDPIGTGVDDDDDGGGTVLPVTGVGDNAGGESIARLGVIAAAGAVAAYAGRRLRQPARGDS